MKTSNDRTFIWISGSINSGKTTVSILLTDRLANGVHIELDLLCSFEHQLPLDKKLNFIIQDGLDLARNWIDRKFTPVLSWPLYGNEVEFMLSYAQHTGIQPILINLVPHIDTVKQNRGQRALTDWELKRIDYMYRDCKMDNPKYGYKIDNSMLTKEDTIDKVVRTLLDDNLLC